MTGEGGAGAEVGAPGTGRTMTAAGVAGLGGASTGIADLRGPAHGWARGTAGTGGLGGSGGGAGGGGRGGTECWAAAGLWNATLIRRP